MPELLTQKDCRSVRDLPFCYLCGQGFSHQQPATDDHVPPTSIFAKSDRNWPLILSAHESCNNDQAGYDEVIGQLVALLHRKVPSREHNRLNVQVCKDSITDIPMAWLHGVAIRPIIFRWVRAFHAALYREFLPGATGGMIYTPFPEGRKDGEVLVINGYDSQRALFVEEIKKNRTARTVDAILIRNGKCRYECVWMHTDDGRSICVFALRLYDWENLGLQTGFPRGCVGYYHPNAGKPNLATGGCRIDFKMTNLERFDPFGR